MQLLRSLGEADKFRVAHPRQKSLNDRPMPRGKTYRITKIFAQAPHTVICVDIAAKDDGFYSLGPGTPVLLPRELLPTEAEVLKFLGVKYRKKVVAYRLLWDGRTELSALCCSQAAAVVRLMFAFGKREYPLAELHELLDNNYEKFWGRKVKRSGKHILKFYRRYLVSRGLIEEVVDDAPISGRIREANLQESL